jgi:hypothetical protein
MSECGWSLRNDAICGEVYVWGECLGECPEAPYPGIEILRVSFEDSAIFRDVIDRRDIALAIRGAAAICAGSGG